VETVELKKRQDGSYEGDLAVVGMKFRVRVNRLSTGEHEVGICAPSESWKWYALEARTLKQSVKQSTWGPVVADALVTRADVLGQERCRISREIDGLLAVAKALCLRTGDYEEQT
jgi:hypothetical protein